MPFCTSYSSRGSAKNSKSKKSGKWNIRQASETENAEVKVTDVVLCGVGSDASKGRDGVGSDGTNSTESDDATESDRVGVDVGEEQGWRDKEGLGIAHDRRKARKASERAKKRARKAEMQAVAMTFIGDDFKEVVKEKEMSAGGNGLHKGSRVGRVGTRKADSLNKGIMDFKDGDGGWFKNRVRTISVAAGELDDDLLVIEEKKREVSLSELIYFAAQKKPKKIFKGHDFEMIPGLKTVIVLSDDDDLDDDDHDDDDTWDHCIDEETNNNNNTSYAQVLAA